MKKVVIICLFLLSSCNNYVDVEKLRTYDADTKISSIRGVVSGVFQKKDEIGGFYIQDSRYFHNKSIFVNSFERVLIGDEIVLNATLTDVKNESQLDNVDVINVLSKNCFIDVEKLSFPISDEQLEQLEGCLVEINDDVQISDSYQFNKYGQLLLAKNQLIQETEIFDAQNDSLKIFNLDIEQELNSIYVDDLSDQKFPIMDSLYIDPSKVVVGAKCSNIKGFISQYNNSYKLRLIDDLIVENVTQPILEDLNSTLTIMNFNMHNLFNGDGQKNDFPTERGAKTYDEYKLQMKKLAAAIHEVDPDIIAMMELENDGEGELSSIQQFCNFLNLNSDRTYTISHSNGVESTYPIKTGIIYDKNVVKAVGEAYYHNHSIFSRPPLFQRFSNKDGLEFVISANHFKSKGSRNATGLDKDQNDGQASFNDKRVQQAEVLLEIIDSLYLKENILVLGDFNAYTQEDPIQKLQSSNLRRLETSNYSYVYRGKMGNLDHVLVSDNFKRKINQIRTWNINAIYPNWIDYSNKIADSSYYRSSDHNPMIIEIN